MIRRACHRVAATMIVTHVSWWPPSALGTHPRIAPRRLGRRLRALQRCLRYCWVLLFIAAGVCCSYSYTEQLGIETVRSAAIHRVEIYDSALKSELARYAYLPSL